MKLKYILLFLMATLTSQTLASDTFKNSTANIEERPIRRTVSRVELMTPEEEEDFNKIIVQYSESHLQETLKDLDAEYQQYMAISRKSMESRLKKLAYWAKFHEKYSGVIRAAGYVMAAAGGICWIVLTSQASNEDRALVLAATVFAGVGYGLTWLANISEATTARIDNTIVGDTWRNRQKASIIDQKLRDSNPIKYHSKRPTSFNQQEESLLNNEEENSHIPMTVVVEKEKEEKDKKDE